MLADTELEQAILTRILRALDMRDGVVVDVGAWNGLLGSNTRFLVVKDWRALLIEGDPARHAALLHNIAAHPRATGVRKIVTLDGDSRLDALLDSAGICRYFSVLNIDIDGNDYWIWKSSRAFPAIVSIEYNCHFGPDESVAMPYNPMHAWQGDDYYGASAAAMVELGREKGYTLVDYTPRSNLFFVRNDLADPFSAVDVRAITKKSLHPHRGRVMEPLATVPDPVAPPTEERPPECPADDTGCPHTRSGISG